MRRRPPGRPAARGQGRGPPARASRAASSAIGSRTASRPSPPRRPPHGSAPRCGRSARRAASRRARSRASPASPRAPSPRPSAASRGLSLDTLLDLSAKLNITLDELLRGDVVPGYRLVRRDDPWTGRAGGPHPLLDDPQAGLRAYVLRLGPGESATPGIVHKGVELVTVASGLVQVQLTTGSPCFAAARRCIAESSRIEGWRNLADRDALVFWVLRDDVRPAESG